MDLPGEGVLRGGRRRQVPGGGGAAARVPGRDVVHRSVHLSVLFTSQTRKPGRGTDGGVVEGKIESQSFEIRRFKPPEVVLELA